ncbi:ribosomal RNA processing protein 36 homolog [Hippoglossus stenolepis]|uniref:ribosomal RNA processing protein 36 homolog n=1 Tax=Hippoglossus stenolepis TaxID=195615 RepID=UPI001FAFBDF1|nr:ribosomal RNA processing protein 36 homolog [Hippoglossus stenolepis]XP_035037028.2 ribosomal RNA processing protein 36 homolog [Hippoglossus stenolepis]
MNGKQQRRWEEPADSKQTKKMKSVDDDNSDVEKNFTLLTERRGRGETEEEQRHNRGEDEEEFSDEGKEEESGEEEESDGGEEDEDDDEEEPDDGGSKIQTREDIKKELSNMSFEDVMKLQNKVGTKVYNEVTYGNSKKPKSGKKKRLNKNRPMEISAKKPAPFLRRVVAIRKPTLRDPRFDDLSGEYKPEIFEKTYKFIDNIKQREKEVVQKQLKRKKMSNEKKEKLQFLLKRMENQERARKSREQQRERELQFKRQQRERANQGAQPFFLKKSEKKKLQLAEKYQELKKSGKLQNFLSKKRKRNAGKDRRKLPPHNAKTS